MRGSRLGLRGAPEPALRPCPPLWAGDTLWGAGMSSDGTGGAEGVSMVGVRRQRHEGNRWGEDIQPTIQIPLPLSSYRSNTRRPFTRCLPLGLLTGLIGRLLRVLLKALMS